MDKLQLKVISNNYQRVRLLSLRNWESASEFPERDHGGPYLVLQEGYAPEDMTSTCDEFLMTKDGSWVTTGLFLRLPRETRQQEFIFGRAAEVIGMLEALPSKACVVSGSEPADFEPASVPQVDDLSAAFHRALQKHDGD